MRTRDNARSQRRHRAPSRLRVALRTFVTLIGFILTAPGILRGQTNGHELAWAGADSIVAVGSGRIGLRIYAWRDFMPSLVRDRDGSDLMVNLQIVSLDAAPLPTGLVVDSAWVRSSEGLWGTAPSHEPRPDLPNGLDLMLRGGPRWATDQTVDVLVRLRRQNGAAYYLQARRQPIGRTS